MKGRPTTERRRSPWPAAAALAAGTVLTAFGVGVGLGFLAAGGLGPVAVLGVLALVLGVVLVVAGVVGLARATPGWWRLTVGAALVLSPSSAATC